MKQVVILGGGFSGVMVAVHLAQSGFPGRIVLVEKGAEVARGVAYSTSFEGHLLNVPAYGMSCYSDRPRHFADWAGARGYAEDAFVPRCLYGQYIGEQFENQAQRIEVVRGEAVELLPEQVVLSDGSRLAFDSLVLALGHFQPQVLSVPADEGFYESEQFQQDPWSSQGSPAVGEVLLVGTGLTAVDKILELQGRCSKLYALSRHGHRPVAHSLPPLRTSGEEAITLDTCAGTLGLLRQFRRELQRRDGNWRHLISTLRQATNSIWQALTVAEQSRFYRHLRSRWDNHRHMIPGEVHSQLQELKHLRFLSGRLRRFHRLPEGRVEVEWSGGKVQVDRVINCTGPSGDIRKVKSSLLERAFASGLLRPHWSHLGIDVDLEYRPLDQVGQPALGLYVMGPLLKGSLAETVAVPELRGQAQRIAQSIFQNSFRVAGQI